MPIDPSIPLGIQAPKFNDPFAMLAQYREDAQRRQQQQQQIQAAQALEEERRQQVADRQRAQKDQETLNQIIAANPTRESLLEAMRTKAPMYYQKALESYAKLDKDAADAQKTVAEAQQAQATAAEKIQGYIFSAAKEVEAHDFSELAFVSALKHAGETFPQLQPRIDDYLKQAQSGVPIKQIVQGLISSYPQGVKTANEAAKVGMETAGTLPMTPAQKAEAEARAATLAQQQTAQAEAARHNRATEAQAQNPSDIVQIMGPNGTPIWVKKSDAVGQPVAQAARAVTGQERQSLAFYNRAKEALDNAQPLEQKFLTQGLAKDLKLQYAPNWLQSDEQQQYRQAQRTFTEARLRKESGAAIPLSEYQNDARTYFRQPGDSPDVIQQKQAARTTVLKGLGYSAGKAFDEFYGEPLEKPSMLKVQPQGGGSAPVSVSVTTPQGMKKYVFPDQASADAFKKAAGIR